MIEAKLMLTVLLMAAIQLVAHFGARAKPRSEPSAERD
jgi:hypothetical protein